MNVQDCAELQDRLARFLEANIGGTRMKDGTYAVKTPFYDSVGDPIYIAIRHEDGLYHIEDTGAIAGHLFTLGQHTLRTSSLQAARQDSRRVRTCFGL